MIKTFKTLFFVKSSLISLYLALTLPIPFISSGKLKLISILIFLLGLILIVNLTDDYVKTCESKISFNSSFISRLLGKKNWEIIWKDIKLIKSLPTSQGSKVHYFVTNKDENFLVPQRIEDFEKFISIIANKTKADVSNLSYISPLWTYKLLTVLSVLMIFGEIIAFSI